MEYTGYKEITMSDNGMAHFYEGAPSNYDLKENEYLVIKNDQGVVVDKYVFKNGALNPVKFQTITNLFTGKIKPLNIEQELAIDLLSNNDVPVKVIRGVYGSGKDLLMFSKALQLLEEGKYNKIYYIRPNVSVKDVPDIGFLPAGIDEKLDWTLGPIKDIIGGSDGVKSLTNTNKLELVPLLYIRGRSFSNSIIYVTEGQNITTEIAKLILGRVGKNSILLINADTHQTDKKIYDQDNGIISMIDKLQGNKLFGYVYLRETLRSDTANLANLLD